MINTETVPVYGGCVEVDLTDPYDLTHKLRMAMDKAWSYASRQNHGHPNLHMRIEGTELFVGYRQSDIIEAARS